MKTAQIKMIFRSWWRNRLNTAISIISLTTGLTCSLILILFVMGEYRIATAFKGAEQLYMIQTDDPRNNNSTKGPRVGHDTPAVLKEKYPEIESVCMVKSDHRLSVEEGNGSEVIGLISPSFTDFQLKMVIGDLHQTLSSPDEAAVTRSYALSRFGKENPIGEQLKITIKTFSPNGPPQTETAEKTITSVIDDSQKSMFTFNILLYLPAEKRDARGSFTIYGSYYGFVKLHAQTDPLELEEKINALPEEERFGTKFYFVPIAEAYFTKNKFPNIMRFQNKSLLDIGISVALIILLIACFNYINLTMTRAAKRLRNIAGQRIMGASLGSVRWQIITETAMQMVVCLLLALCLIDKLLPEFNRFMNSQISMQELLIPDNILVIALLLLAITLLPSFYILAKLHTGQSLLVFLKKGTNRKSYLSQGMVVAQFAISVVLIIVSINIYRQIHLLTAIRPYTKDIVTVTLWGLNEDKVKLFIDRIDAMAFTQSYSRCSPHSPTSIIESSTRTNPETGEPTEIELHYNIVNADKNFFEFYGEEIIQGTTFSNDPSVSCRQRLVNETFIRQHQITDPIGHSFKTQGDTVTIVGVVKDMPRENLKNTIQPIIYRPTSFEYPQIHESRNLAVQVQGISQTDAINELKTIWKEIAPDEPMIEPSTLEQFFLNTYQEELRVSKMVITFTGISILLTILGLFGLAWYSVERRSKEIALRKIHGAKTGEVVLMLCSGFTKWVLIAFIPAIPAAYYFSARWFSDFTFKVGMSVWVYLFTAGLVILIGIGTVLFQSRRAARRNPIKAIQTE